MPSTIWGNTLEVDRTKEIDYKNPRTLGNVWFDPNDQETVDKLQKENEILRLQVENAELKQRLAMAQPDFMRNVGLEIKDCSS